MRLILQHAILGNAIFYWGRLAFTFLLAPVPLLLSPAPKLNPTLLSPPPNPPGAPPLMPPPRFDPIGLKDVADGALNVDEPKGPDGAAGVEDTPPKGILELEPNDDPPKEGAELPKGALVDAMPPNIPPPLDEGGAGNPNDGP